MAFSSSSSPMVIEGVVDLRPIIAQGECFKWLQKPKNFSKVQLEEYGHHVFWVDDKGREIDLGADGLRRDAEKQAELHKLDRELSDPTESPSMPPTISSSSVPAPAAMSAPFARRSSA